LRKVVDGGLIALRRVRKDWVHPDNLFQTAIDNIDG
jgi:hypothetical protein